jgi:hypothetical protein
MAEDKPNTPTTPKSAPPEPPARPPMVHEIKPGEIPPFAGQGGMNSPHAAQLLSGAAVLAGQAGMNIDETFPGGIAGIKALLHPLTYSHGPGGRPSSRLRVWEEAMRRLYHNRPAETLEAFSVQLSRWLEEQLDETTMAQVPQMKPRTVELNIKDLWNAWHRCRGCPTGPVD